MKHSRVNWRTKIKKLRAQHDWTQGELAERLGVSRATVNRWEKKRNNLTPSQLAQMALQAVNGGRL